MAVIDDLGGPIHPYIAVIIGIVAAVVLCYVVWASRSLYHMPLFLSSYTHRSSPYNYEITLDVIEDLGGPIHPYIAVIIGIVAAVVLCLGLTLSRRIFLRHAMFSQLRTRMGVRLRVCVCVCVCVCV